MPNPRAEQDEPVEPYGVEMQQFDPEDQPCLLYGAPAAPQAPRSPRERLLRALGESEPELWVAEAIANNEYVEQAPATTAAAPTTPEGA